MLLFTFKCLVSEKWVGKKLENLFIPWKGIRFGRKSELGFAVGK